MIRYILVADSIEDTIETLLIATTSIPCVTKILFLFICRRDIRQIFDIMNRLEESTVTSITERCILVAAQRAGSLGTILLFSGTIVLCPIIAGSSLYHRILIWPSLYPVDWQTNNVWYGVVMTYQIISMMYTAISIIGADMWRISAMCMLSGYIDVLRGRMQSLGFCKVNDLKDVPLVMVADANHSANQDRLHEQELIDCVKYHQLCLECFGVLNISGKLHFLVQFASSTTQICVGVYRLTTIHPIDDTFNYIWSCGFLLMCCIQLMVPCYFSSYLSDKTDQLSFSLYDSNWPDMSPKFKSIMRIVLEATKESINFNTSWNLIIISLPTFVSVVRSAYSMLSFLKGIE